MLPLRPLGASGLTVTALGFGAMQVGDPALSERDAARMLHHALDLGIALVDTARSYGLSEERIGRHLASRRDRFLLSTKVGYGVEGVEDWTAECVRRGIDDARRRLGTDVIDLVHLHSCDAATLARPGLVDALLEAAARGAVRVPAYSGDGAAASAALGSGRFGAWQVSLSLCDLAARESVEAAARAGTGVLVKRPLAGLPWREAGDGDATHEEYRRRFARLRPWIGEQDWPGFALRFAAFAPGVASCLVGGRSPAQLEANVRAVGRGALAAEDQSRVLAAFAAEGAGWEGRV